jgi:hypothetical protein
VDALGSSLSTHLLESQSQYHPQLSSKVETNYSKSKQCFIELQEVAQLFVEEMLLTVSVGTLILG